MDVSHWQQWVTLFKDTMTGFALLAGGLWAGFKFLNRREARAKIQFDVDLNILGPAKEQLIVEIVVVVENKGLVRHKIRQFSYSLFYLLDGDPIVDGSEEIDSQIEFTPRVVHRSLVRKGDEYTFIDPGVTQRYTRVTHVPGNAQFLLLSARFAYPDTESEFHSAQRVFRVPRVNGGQ